MKLTELSAKEIAQGVREKRFSAQEVVQSHLDRIRSLDAKLKAFLRVFEEKSLAQAKAVDEKLQNDRPLGRLAGVPVALKDNILIEGTETTCGSKILQGYSAPYDATVVERLKAEDAVLIGKTNMDEFAMGSSTENSAFFPTKNPWDLQRVPGGSSGGSAAAVSAGLVPVALGSDTGGSVRQPAALCSIVGLKPTYGAVSRYGLVAFASSLDQIGPLTRDIQDASLVFSVISGHDPKDSTSAQVPSFQDGAEFPKNLQGLKIGLPKEYFIPGLDPEMAKAAEDCVKVLERLGAKVLSVSLPHTDYAVSTYYILAPSEASANLARYDGIRYGPRSQDGGSLLELYEKTRGEGFGPEVKRRIMLGTYALSSGYYEAYYLKAQKVRTLICRDFEQAFKEADLILTPTSPTPAFKLGEKVSDPLQMYLSDIFTIPCNLAGIAGISAPCGFSSSGLPLGIQFLCRPFEEKKMFWAAHLFLEETQCHKKRPSL